MNIDDIMHPLHEATLAQKRAALDVVFAIAEAIRTLGSVPSGELYARVMNVMSLQSYQQVIASLVAAGVVEESAHMLRWIGPTLSDAKQP